MPAQVARAWVELRWLQFWMTAAKPPLELVLLPVLSPPLELVLLPPQAHVPFLVVAQRLVGELPPELGRGPGLAH